MKRILIVDNKEESLRLLQGWICDHGHEVVIANDEAEALALARCQVPDLLVFAQHLPEKGGCTLLSHWRDDARLREVPFMVYTTDSGESECIPRAQEMGAEAFRLDPAEPAAFLRLMQAVFDETKNGAASGSPAPAGLALSAEASLELIRKLEEQTLQLQAANLALEKELGERRQIEHALRTSETGMVLAQRVGNFGTWEIDLTTSKCLWSDMTYKILEVEPGGAQPGYESYLMRVHPEDRELVDQVFRDSWTSVEAQELDHRILLPDGRIKYLTGRWQVFWDEAGQPVRAIGTTQDITRERLVAAEAHRTSELLKALADNTSDALFVKDLKGTYLLFNRGAAKAVGLPSEAVVGRDDLFVFGEEGARSVRVNDFEVLDHEASVTAEEVVSIGGVTRTFVATKAPYYDVQGNIAGIVGVSRDVTPNKEAEMALRRLLKENLDLRTALNEHAIVARTDAAGRITEVNDRFCQLSQYSREELLGQDHRMMNSGHHSKEFFQTLWQTIRSGQVWNGEICNRAKEGGLYWVATTIVPFLDEEGMPHQYVVIRADVTERKRAEEAVREQATLLDRARDAILARDLNHVIQYWNRGAENLYGWTAEEAVGQSIEKLLYQPPATVFLEATHTTLREGEWQGELRQTTKDGRTVTVEGRWTLMRDEQGRPKSILAINTDITERKLLEQQFLRAQRMESIGTLAGGIAHDLNNVLSPILMSIELLRMNESNAQRLDILNTVEASTRRGADMVKQVLSFARGMEGQQLVLQLEPLLREVEKIANETFLKNITVTCTVDPELWRLKGDATQLHQVLINLCVNARDAMPDGGTLVLEAGNVFLDEHYAAMNLDAKPGHYLQITVEDSGCGMSPEVMERIFEPFYTTKELGSGTGLGLSTTLAIVKSHQGFLRVYSEEGRGTRIQVFLPAYEEDGEGIEKPGVPDLPRGKGETVLLVEDELAVRQITRQTLEAFGYHVIEAADGAEATATYALRQKEIAVVLTDMMMPVMDGPSMIPVLLRIRPEVRIIAASGLSANAMVIRAANAGVRHFLPKPYTAETLLKKLHEVLAEQI